ncbi:MAG: MoxR family ATPase [Kiritimatiellae bacterium]|nr:MoxR family ATPase [Kiritimatiellia bacterium]
MTDIRQEVNKVIVGQEKLIDRMIIALITGGHILLEGVPGLAKTTAVRTLSDALGLQFQRISFTPDLLPADVVGTMIYNPKEGSFSPKRGPVFTNLLLADEINRAPAKVQSALLEAMQERQVTISDNTYKLPEPFLVMATQNPIEQEGTYPLPEAQVDRFMLKCVITHPSRDDERRIMNRFTRKQTASVRSVITADKVNELRETLEQVYCDEKVGDYILDIVFATREPKTHKLDSLAEQIQMGASPRATLCLNLAARANAMLNGRAYATPQDVKEIAHDVLRHRIMLTYEAEAEEVTTDKVIADILNTLPVP